MIKKYLAKKAAKKSASWVAKTEAKVVFTTLATVATAKLFKLAANKYPTLRFLETKKS